jgi:hypothetical protein
MEKQCSRVEWLCEGDHNTTFFQAKAKQRTSTNKIKVLKRPDGSICTRQEELESLAADFYQQLFSAQAHSTPEDVVHFVPHKVTPAMNTLLDAPFRACLVQLHEQLHEQLHNFNSQTANSLPNSLVSFSENSLSQS